jgi:hypothetical protein
LLHTMPPQHAKLHQADHAAIGGAQILKVGLM